MYLAYYFEAMHIDYYGYDQIKEILDLPIFNGDSSMETT